MSSIVAPIPMLVSDGPLLPPLDIFQCLLSSLSIPVPYHFLLCTSSICSHSHVGWSTFFVSKIYCPHSCVWWSAFLDSKVHFIPMSVPSLLKHWSISCPMVHSLSMSIQLLSHHPLCTLLLNGPLPPPLDQFLSLSHPIPSHFISFYPISLISSLTSF